MVECIDEEKSIAIQAIESSINRLKEKDEFGKLKESQQNSILAPMEDELNKVQKLVYIAVIRDTKLKVTDVLSTKQLNAMLRIATPTETSEDGKAAEPKIHYIKRSNVKAKYEKTELKTEDDVDEYVESLREALKEQIKNNRRIEL